MVVRLESPGIIHGHAGFILFIHTLHPLSAFIYPVINNDIRFELSHVLIKGFSLIMGKFFNPFAIEPQDIGVVCCNELLYLGFEVLLQISFKFYLVFLSDVAISSIGVALGHGVMPVHNGVVGSEFNAVRSAGFRKLL